MNTPTLSIIIPVYNAGESITTLTYQILSQPFHDFELILVDDGSTDNTLSVLRGIAKNDERVIVRSKKNGGPSSARNSGLDKARGTYVMFCDADDMIDPNIFVKMVKEIDENKTDLVVCGWKVDLRTNKKLLPGYKTISPEREIVSGSPLERDRFILRSIGTNGQLYNLWNKIFKRDIIEQYSLRFREDIHFGEDLIFSLQYFKHISQLKLIPDALYHYQTNSATSLFSSSALVLEYRAENYHTLTEYVGESKDNELLALYNWIRWRWLLSFHLIVSKSSRSNAEKVRLITQVRVSDLSVSGRRYIGIKKWLIECIMNLTHRSAHASILLASLINLIKQTIITLKSLR